MGASAVLEMEEDLEIMAFKRSKVVDMEV